MDLISRRDLARELGCTTRTVDRMVRRGQLPQPVKISRKMYRFHRADVEAMLAVLSTPAEPVAS